MIKTKELMLGNWVLAGKNAKFPMQVVSIFENEVYLDFEGNEGDGFEEKEEDMFPMLLTGGILLKNGFTNYLVDNEGVIVAKDVTADMLASLLD